MWHVLRPPTRHLTMCCTRLPLHLPQRSVSMSASVLATSNLRLPARTTFRSARPARRPPSIVVRAAAQPPRRDGAAGSVMPALQAMFQRYDFVSAGKPGLSRIPLGSV